MAHFWQTVWEQIGGRIGLVAYVTGIVSVYYAVRNKIGTWPWGIVSVILFGRIFWLAKDPSNAGLQILYYLPISIYGWWVWLRCGPKKDDDLPVTMLSNTARAGWLAVTAVLCLLWGYLEAYYKKDATMPYSDAATTVISIVAQYLQTRKKFENWILWIAADIVYAFWLFPRQQLTGLASLYVLFLLMAVVGAQQWLVVLRNQKKPVVIEEPAI